MQMNELCSVVDNKSQFDFHRLSIRKKKRFSQWVKKETEENIDLIRQACVIQSRRLEKSSNILSPQDLEQLRKALYTGGISK
jgi:hypothetical protein